MKEKLVERLKSKVVWLAVLSQVLIIISLCVPQISDTVKTVVTALLEILTLFGVLNNPADKENF